MHSTVLRVIWHSFAIKFREYSRPRNKKPSMPVFGDGLFQVRAPSYPLLRASGLDPVLPKRQRPASRRRGPCNIYQSVIPGLTPRKRSNYQPKNDSGFRLFDLVVCLDETPTRAATNRAQADILTHMIVHRGNAVYAAHPVKRLNALGDGADREADQAANFLGLQTPAIEDRFVVIDQNGGLVGGEFLRQLAFDFFLKAHLVS